MHKQIERERYQILDEEMRELGIIGRLSNLQLAMITDANDVVNVYNDLMLLDERCGQLRVGDRIEMKHTKTGMIVETLVTQKGLLEIDTNVLKYRYAVDGDESSIYRMFEITQVYGYEANTLDFLRDIAESRGGYIVDIFDSPTRDLYSTREMIELLSVEDDLVFKPYSLDMFPEANYMHDIEIGGRDRTKWYIDEKGSGIEVMQFGTIIQRLQEGQMIKFRPVSKVGLNDEWITNFTLANASIGLEAYTGLWMVKKFEPLYFSSGHGHLFDIDQITTPLPHIIPYREYEKWKNPITVTCDDWMSSKE